MSEDVDRVATVDERGPAKTDAGAASSPLADGARDTRYRRGAEIGQGGMGRVVEATDAVLGRTVAIKEIRGGDGDLAQRFEREVYVTARLEHPSIVPVYDAGRTGDGLPFYVMRRVTGRPLDALIAEAAGLDGRLALIPNLLAAADAVAHAHRRGVIHRDLKPANVLVGDHGETLVIDWGLAKLVDEAADAALPRRPSAPPGDGRLSPDSLETRVGTVIGTPGFMPPEQALGLEVDPRGDVYALGACLYQLLAGAAPWAGTKPTEILDRVVAEPPPPVTEIVAGVPPDLVAIVTTAMAHDAGRRYPDAGALGDDLRRFLRGQLVAAHRYSAGQRFARWVRRNRAALAVATAAAAALIVVGVLALVRIVADRDRIRAREHDAIAARDDARDQADGLVIENARAALDRDPSYALARLATLRPDSPRWPAARAVAIAARARGVAVAYPGQGEPPWTMAMALDGVHVAAGGRGDTVYVHDLVHRTTTSVTAPRAMAPLAWLGDRLALAGTAGLTLVDVATGARTELAAPGPVDFLTADADGTAIGYLTEAGRGFVISAGGAPIELPADGAPIQYVRIAAGGTRAVVQGATTRALVRDGPGWRTVLTRPASRAFALAADGSRLAIKGADLVLREWLLTADAATEAGHWPLTAMTEVLYTGTVLMVQDLGTARLVDYHLPSPETLVGGIFHLPLATGTIADGALAIAEDDDLILTTQFRTVRIAMPEVGHRVVARPGSPFVAVGTSAHVLVWDLREVWPELVSGQPVLQLDAVSADTVMAYGIERLRLFDRDGTHRDLPPLGPSRFRIAAEAGLVIQIDPTEAGRIDVLDAVTGARTRLAVPEAYAATGYGRDALAVLAGPQDIVIAPLAGGAPRPVAHVDARLDWLEVEGRWIAGLGPHHVWRGDGTAAALVPFDAPQAARLDTDGTLYVSTDAELFRWLPGAPGPVPFARLDGIPVAMARIRDRSLAIAGADRALYVVDLDTAAVRQALPASEHKVAVSFDATTACVINDAKLLEVVDLVTGERWTLPTAEAELTRTIPAADGRSIYAIGSFNHVVRFPIGAPRDPAELRAWIAAGTNARAGTAGLVEWQLPTPTPVR